MSDRKVLKGKALEKRIESAIAGIPEKEVPFVVRAMMPEVMHKPRFHIWQVIISLSILLFSFLLFQVMKSSFPGETVNSPAIQVLVPVIFGFFVVGLLFVLSWSLFNHFLEEQEALEKKKVV